MGHLLLKLPIINISFRRFYTQKMKYLNVAEKNDAAKNIAGFLSRGTSRRREGLSPYNKIYEFDTAVNNQNVTMVMTSVSGHMLNYEFPVNFRNWNSTNPLSLFDAPVIKACTKDGEKIKKTLEREIRSCQALIIWTDCDREGENIGYEIIKVCTDIKQNLQIYRAKFSEITSPSVFRALNNLGRPDKNVSDAVDVRQEMDLRTGAAFTRLQTLHLRKVFPQKLAEKTISYGSCQFPTLGFVVDRYKDIENFIPEPFWKIRMEHTKDELTVDFHWERDRMFVKQPVDTIVEMCKENPTVRIVSVLSKPKSRWRPLPLDTIEMEKNISRKLKINAKETMRIAERLYTQGLISYPRTETNIFPKELNLRTLVEQQTVNNTWGVFATRVLNENGPNPRQGKKSDQAHPPIHPTKHTENLNGNDKRVYEYIVRHFLACVYKDALGHETVVTADISNETFIAKGLLILEKNYLDVYIYEKWNGKEIHSYQQDETFQPTVLQLEESMTTPPKFLTEADLISLMEKNGIGTDATHADHIDTIKSREYVGLHENVYFVPAVLGMGLVEGYDNIGLEVSLAKPILRSDFEKDLKLICDGRKDHQVVLQEQKVKYRAMFQNVLQSIREIENKLSDRLQEQRVDVGPTEFQQEAFQSVLTCPKCRCDMVVRKRKNNQGFYIGCCGFPECKNAIWLPVSIESVQATQTACQRCAGNTKKIKVKFKQGQNPFIGEPNEQILCIGGCEENVLQALNISINSVRRGNANDDNNVPVNNHNNYQPPPPPPGGGNAIRSNNRQTGNNNNNNNSNRGGNQIRRNGGGNNNSDDDNDDDDSGYGTNTRQTQTARGRATTQPTNRSVQISEEAVLCECGTAALLLTVRKDGPNQGRTFYKCNNGICNYFKWAEEAAQSNRPSTSNTQRRNNATTYCNCGQPAAEKVVQKNNDNKGRTFYSCSGSIESRCNFFQWANDTEASTSHGNAPYRPNNSKKRKKPQNKNNKKPKISNVQLVIGVQSNQRQARPRKCGLCGTEGHTKKNCPNK